MNTRTLTLVVALLCGVFTTSPAQQTKSKVLAQTDRITLRASGKHAQQSDRTHFRFTVEDRASGTTKVIETHSLLTAIERTVVANDKAVVLGSRYSQANGAILLDLESARQQDFLLAYEPVVSPGGRYIAFKRWYPRFSDAEATSDVLMIYDTQRSNEANRVIPARRGEAEDVSYAQFAGFPVYPAANAGQTYEVWVAEEASRHSIYLPEGALAATETDGRIAFVDVIGGEHWLVEVDISGGLLKPTARKARIDLGAITERPDVAVYVKSLRRLAEGTYALSLRPELGLSTTGVKVVVRR